MQLADSVGAAEADQPTPVVPARNEPSQRPPELARWSFAVVITLGTAGLVVGRIRAGVASGRRGVSIVEHFLLLGPDPPTTLVGDAPRRQQESIANAGLFRASLRDD